MPFSFLRAWRRCRCGGTAREADLKATRRDFGCQRIPLLPLVAMLCPKHDRNER